jgi:hypothetical protein
VLVPAGIIVAVSFALLPFADGAAVWVLMIINGIARGCLMPLLSTIAIEKKAVGPRYAGTTIGLIMTFNMLGCAICPPLGNSLAGINPGFPIILWAAISALSLIGFFFIKEKRGADSVTTP